MWSASKWSWCIFQLPLTSGRRSPDFFALAIDVAAATQPNGAERAGGPGRSVRPQRGQRGQVAVLDQLQRRAAAGRDEIDPAGQTELVERGGAVAAADDGEAAASATASATVRVPAANRSSSNDAHRPVPQHGPRIGDGVGEHFADSGPMSSPSQPSGRSVPTTWRDLAARAPRSPNVPPGSSATTSVGSRTRRPGLEQMPAVFDLVEVDQRSHRRRGRARRGT